MSDDELIAGLEPLVQVQAWDHIARCAKLGIAIRITQGYRTFAEQQAYFDQVPKVTNARPGYSWHNWRRAYDVAIVTFPGDTTPGDVYDGPWSIVGQQGEAAGMAWGGRWKHPDLPHFEKPSRMTLAELIRDNPEGLA